jgi:HPt (histidine-containing phosphotransfer) domain-containing protein
VLKDLSLPAPDTPVIDESRLLEEFGGDLEILAELRDLFLAHVPPLYAELEQAMDDGNAADLAKHAHTLKGACATYGAPRLAQVCKEIELLARQDDLESAAAYREHLSREYAALSEAITSVGAG